MRRMRQAENNNKTDRQDPNKLPSTEVFDSSRYNAMDDMTKGATTTNQLPDKQQQAVMDVQTREPPLDPGEIKNEALVVEETPKPPDARINPIMTEERARTMREMHEEMTSSSSPPNAGTEENAREEEVRVVEHKSDGYNAIPEWIGAMMRQYAEMANAGMRLYSQFLESSADAARLWFAAWWRWWLPSSNKD